MKNPLSPLRFLQRAASVHPDRTAIIDGPRSVTYREMTEQVTRLAQASKLRPEACNPVTGWPILRRTARRSSWRISRSRWPVVSWSP